MPEHEQILLQHDIIDHFGIREPEQHYSWISKKSLGPVFVYRTNRDTSCKFYPAMNVSIDNNVYTIGTSKPVDEVAIHYFTLGSNGVQIDFMNQEPYSMSNADQKTAVNNAVSKIIDAINGNGTVDTETQIIYAENKIVGSVYPEIIYEEAKKAITFKA